MNLRVSENLDATCYTCIMPVRPTWRHWRQDSLALVSLTYGLIDRLQVFKFVCAPSLGTPATDQSTNLSTKTKERRKFACGPVDNQL